MPTAILIKDSKNGCSVTYVNQLDLGGQAPHWVMNIAIKKNLDLTFKMQQHFLQRLGRGGEGGDGGRTKIGAEDAKTLGYHFIAVITQKKKSNEADVVADFVQRYYVMKGLKEEYDWIEVMFVEIAKMRFKKMGNAVNDPLVRLSHKGARVIGRNFAHALRQRKTAAAGVDQWRVKYPAVRELMKREPWFQVSEGERVRGGRGGAPSWLTTTLVRSLRRK